MDVNKVLFISQEITPYVPESPIATIGSDLPQRIQELGYEVRTFMPKYGCINERRNQLHEVIRLSGMNIIIDDSDHPLIIKVATLLPARMQVYFIYNDDYFMHNVTKDIETEISPEDNDERSIFFVRGVMETVKKLRWEPEIIHCNGWISALTPLYLKHMYNEDPIYAKSKVVYSLYDDAYPVPFDARLAEKMKMDGISAEDVACIEGKAVDHTALTKLAIANSHGVIQQSKNVSQEIIDFVKELGIPFLPYEEDNSNYAERYAEFYKSL